MMNKNDDPLMDEPDTLADFDDNGDFSEFDQKRSGSSFGDLVKSNPLIKIGMVVAALIVIIGSVMMFGGDKKETVDSVVPTGSDLKETPGTSEVSPEMKQALEDFNQQQIEQAIQTGDSVLPTPIEPPKERLPVPENGTGEDDPLLRWRQMQEERLQAEQQTLQTAEQTQNQQPAGPDPALGALTAAMSSQMSQILGEKPAESLKYMQVTDLTAFIQAMNAAQGAGDANVTGNNPRSDGNYTTSAGAADGLIDPATGQAIAPPKILIKAGSIEYGQLINEANSDIPGPIVALIASGKFSGSRMIGSFERRDKYLIISFSTLVDKKGVSIPVEAYALDPNTTLSGMATEVDNRYWQRVVLPAAAEFIEGLGEAVAESGDTTVTVSGDTVIQEENDIDTRQELYKGVERAAERVGDLLDEEADKTEILVRVAAGTPMGILFTTPVTDQDRLAGQYNPSASGGFRQPYAQQQGGFGGQQLIQSLGQGGAGLTGLGNTNDTDALLESLRTLQQNTSGQ